MDPFAALPSLFGKSLMLGGNVTSVVDPVPTDLGGGISFQGTGVIIK